MTAGNGENGIHCLQQVEGNEMQRPGFCKDQFSLIPMTKLGGCPIKSVSAGEEHVAVINKDGQLWTWGLNDQGQCGIEQDESEIISTPVMPFKGVSNGQISLVACGGKHTLALSAHREVFAWGNN